MTEKTVKNNNQTDATPLIILADDDPSIRLILHHILQRDGYRVLDASNGREVLRLYQQNPPNLVLLDAVMPEQDGFVTCRMLKELQPDLPVLMITGLDDDQSVEHAFRVGADDYISKPINWSVLKHRIAKTLSSTSPCSTLDQRILNNNLQCSYSPQMELSGETIIAIEARAPIPVSAVLNKAATVSLLNQFAMGYQQAKQPHAAAHLFSLPILPSLENANNILAALMALDTKYGIPLESIELRIHECHFLHESILRLLPLIAPLPVHLCIDAFSFSLRSLDCILNYGCKNIMIDIGETQNNLAKNNGWLDAALQLYKDKGVSLHACGVSQPDDLQLAIRIGCTTASGSAINPG